MSLTSKVVRHIRHHGFRSTVSAIRARLIQGSQNSAVPTASGKIDFITHYEKILGHAHGDPKSLEGLDPKTIQWVIPNFGFGSGGHLNIFRYINLLAERGYRQRLVILEPYEWQSVAAATDAIADWYFPLKAEVALGVDGFAPSAVTMATGWQTAYWVAKHEASAEKIYFVQDFEPYFHPVSSEYFITENTYRLGLKAITAGDWLAEKLHDEFNMETEAISFGVEHDRYIPSPRRENSNFNILFYSRHVTPRRLFELGLVALNRVCEENENVAVIFAGGDVGGVHVPFHHLNAGELSLSELPDLYSQCDLGVVLSGTNLSLLPLELAACNCPVVMNDTASTRWLLPDNAAFYADPTPDALYQVITEAIQSPKLRQDKVKNAKKVALSATWEEQADRIDAIIQKFQKKDH